MLNMHYQKVFQINTAHLFKVYTLCINFCTMSCSEKIMNFNFVLNINTGQIKSNSSD